jgi:hypothetical protein
MVEMENLEILSFITFLENQPILENVQHKIGIS